MVPSIDIDEAKKIEDKMYNQKVETGELKANEEKRTHDAHSEPAPPPREK